LMMHHVGEITEILRKSGASKVYYPCAHRPHNNKVIHHFAAVILLK
jgi:hypothetical protein